MNMKAILLNFFQALFFTTSEVVFITTKIVFIFMSLTVVHIYDFHIFTGKLHVNQF